MTVDIAQEAKVLPIGQAVRAPKTAEIIASNVRRSIVSGVLKEGDTLPSEIELMNQFGVSRPTLREAFRILETESLISIRRGSHGGAQVMAPDLSVAGRYVGLILQMNGTTIGEVFEARAAVEVEAARMMASRRRSADLDDLTEILEQLRVLPSEVQDQRAAALAGWSKLSWRFHELIMARCGNRALHVQWSVLRDIMETHGQSTIMRSLEHPQTPQTMRKALRSYEKLIELLREKDVSGATQHWRAHMDVSTKILAGREESQAIVDLFD